MLLAVTSIDEVAAIVFIDIALILVAARVMGRLAQRVHQPAVVGEIIAGLALGPSLLGLLPGDIPGTIFPTDARPFLQVVAQLGLVMFMFIVGLELDLTLIRGKARTAIVISFSSIALPFILGVVLAFGLHGSHDTVGGENVELLPFALFIGAAMSVTAFPVLARILHERQMIRTSVGALTLACAAVDDVVAWSLLAVVLAVVSSSGAWDLPRILAESALFVIVMVGVIRPLLARLVTARYEPTRRLAPDLMAVMLIGVLASAYITAEIGIHQIFGAFLFGAIVPRKAGGELLAEIVDRLETVAVLLLLPVFFVATGLQADIGAIDARGLGELLLILLVACAGKFLGAMAGARTQGIRGRQAATIGTLMNTRGLTELVILNVGLAFGVLDRELFTLLVIMAVVTTVMAEPILRVTYPRSLLRREIAEAERAALTVEGGYRVLVSVGEAAHAVRMVDLAVDLVGAHDAAEVVITRFAARDRMPELGSGIIGERARIAASMDDLHELASRVASRGVRSAVLYQFSDDVAADLIAQVASVDAHVLLVGGPRAQRDEGREALGLFTAETGQVYEDFLHRVLAGAPCDVGVLVHPFWERGDAVGRQPIVLTEGGPHGAAAREFADRVAASRAAALEAVVPAGDRSADDLLADVARRALPASLVVVGAGDWEAGGRFGAAVDAVVDSTGCPVLVVRGREPRTVGLRPEHPDTTAV